MRNRILAGVAALILLLSAAGCASAPREESAAAGQETAVPGETAPAGQETAPEKADDSTETTTHKQGETLREETQPGPTGTPDEKNDEKTEDPEKEPEKTDPKKDETEPEEDEDGFPVYSDYSGFIKVASFNVEGLREDREGVFAQIREYDPDIIGLQELDQNNSRANEDQIRVLAEKCGYEYYGFDNCVNIYGGAYGVGILSKFPIKNHTTVQFKVIAPGDHTRAFGRYELNVRGKTLVFYNTHLTLGSVEVNGQELKQLTDMMVKDKYAVATGDFNMQARHFFEFLDPNKLTVLNGGGDFVTVRNTFPAGENPTTAIDNIICTANMKHYWDREANVGVIVVKSLVSDHNMIYSYIDFP